MPRIQIDPYQPSQRQALLDLTLRAWAPVFDRLEPEVDAFVFSNFYPNGWQARQLQDIGTFLDGNVGHTIVATYDDRIAGFAGISLYPADKMGEITVIAVDPAFQRKGIAQLLIARCEDLIRTKGMDMVMIETGDDSGHRPARETYQSQGYRRWPVARYFKKL